MTQAEKAQLRYVAIMEQSSNAMQDLARTSQTPSNALRILNQQITQLSRALGNLLIPLLQQIIPWVQAFVEVITEAIQALAVLFGFELPTIDYSGLEGVAGGATDASDALNDAAEAAKKLQDYTLGIDELNIISPGQTTSGGAGGVSGGDLGLELPEYDFLGDLTKQTNEIKKRLEPILKTVLAIGAAFLAWKIGDAIINGLSFFLQNLKSVIGTLGFVIGLATFLYNVFDALANGLDMSNLIGMIAGVGVAMGALVLMGRTLVAGLVGIAGGITIVAISIKDAIENGLNETNLAGIVAGITVSVLGLYLAFGRVGLIIGSVIGGITLLTTGFNDFIDNGKTDYNVRAIAEGFMLLGVGISLINPKIGLVIIGVGILVTAFLEFGDEAVGVLNVVWAAIKNTGGALGNLAVTAGAAFDNILKFAENLAIGIKNSFFALIENLKAAFNNGWINIQSGFLGFYKTILSGIVSIAEKINSLTSIFGIEIDVSGINAEIQEIADTQKELDESKREYSDIGEAFSEGMGTFQYNDLSAAMSTFETFSDGWINQAYEDGKAVGTALQNGFRDMLASAKDQMSGMVSGLFGGEDSADSLVDEYKQSFSEISSSMGSNYNLMEEYNKSLSSAAGQDFSAMSDSFIGNTDIMRAQSGLLKDTALTDIETTKTTMESSLAESLDTNQRFTTSVESMYKTMASRSNSAIQSIISSLNSIPRNITTVHTIITKSISGGSSSKAYASGGFPDTGQMFIARERGPELVGTIGNRTAVANNAQIVQGIASGVADANQEQNTLLREQNELLRAILAKEGTVKIGNKAIKKAYDTASRQSGASIMPGGVMT